MTDANPAHPDKPTSQNGPADDFAAAVEAVRAAIAKFDQCTEEELLHLQSDIDDLERMAEKLQSGRIDIVVFGEISTGKSALVNALVGEQKTKVNVQGGWTKDLWHIAWDELGFSLPGFDNSQVVLVDTPGLNEVAGEARAEMARSAAQRADLVLFVTDSDLNETEYSALIELAASHKPILLVLNKSDLYSREELLQLENMLRGPRLAGIVDPNDIVVTQADPREVEYVIEAADGSTRQEWRKPAPQVDQLRQRILAVLEADGQALVALNGAMFAADKSDRMGAVRVQMRESKAATTIWSYAVTKSLAVALNPGAVLDVLGGSAVDATMVVNLGRIYGIGITTTNARELVTSILKVRGLGNARRSGSQLCILSLQRSHARLRHGLDRPAPRCGCRLRLLHCRASSPLLLPTWCQLG